MIAVCPSIAAGTGDAMNDATRRALRTLIQLIAAGGLTALVNQLAGDLPSRYAPYLLIAFTLLVTFCQNWLEDNTAVPAVLKSTPVAPSER
jgi:hypothetical protein